MGPLAGGRTVSPCRVRGGEAGAPGVPDPACPAQATLSGGTNMPGCCTDEGFCGSIDSIAPFGCFYATGMHGLRCGAADQGDPDGDAGS